MTISSHTNTTVFERLGIKPVINASGIYTDLGGSILSDELWADLTELNTHFVDMVELLNQTGDSIAQLVGAEAARVTPGASAGIALATGAVMAGNHGPNWEQLPDTTGMRDQIILQHKQVDQYKYLNPVRLAGAQVVLAGDENGTTIDDIRKACTDKTAAIFVPAHLDVLNNIVKMEELGPLSKELGVKFLIDAAYQVFPAEKMRDYAALGADLTMISSKYFFGPNAGGFLSGTREMMDIVSGLDFTQFESGQYRTFGRPFKMGRYEISAVYLALKTWFETDHVARWDGYKEKADYVTAKVNALDGLSASSCCFTFDETIEPSPVNCSMIKVNHPNLRADSLVKALEAQSPMIYAVPFEGDVLIVTETLRDGDEQLIAARIENIMNEAG